MSHVRPIPPEEATGVQVPLYEGITSLLGRVANSYRVMAHAPYVAQVMLPLTVTLMREGLGTILPSKLKEMAVIKTSQLNGCEY
jgi:alkylhydroperoxidase family enzyme